MSLSDEKIVFRDEPCSSDVRKANLYPSKGTHGVAYKNHCLLDSYGCAPPQKLSGIFIKRNEHCLCLYKIQGLISKRGCFCTSFCVNIIYFVKLSKDFYYAVLKFYYQTNS